jgi:hypothetical protein
LDVGAWCLNEEESITIKRERNMRAEGEEGE